MNWKSTCAWIGLSALAIGCSSNNATAPSLSASLTTVGTKLAAAADIIGDSSRSARSRNPFRATGINAVWTTSGGVNALSNSGSETLQAWIGHMFDPSFVNSNDAKVTFAGRISNELSVLCFISNGGLPTDATGLPTDGTHSLTLTEAMATACGEDAGEVQGATVSMTVETPAVTTNFVKSMSVTMPGAESCPYKFLAKVTADDINIASAEDQSCDSRNQASGSVFRYNAATKVSRFTYISQNFDSGSRGFEFYRGVLDETADEAYVLGIYGGQEDGELSNYIAFTAAGKPVGGTKAALSTKTASQTIANGEYNGCILTATNAVDTDNTLACDVTGTDISTAFTVITSSKAANTAIASIYAIDGSTDLRFTGASDIYTY